MNYYLHIKDNKIASKGNVKIIADDFINIKTTQEIYENSEKYTYSNGEIILNENYEQEQAEIEQTRINNLTMTALDFITGLKTLGLSLETINTYLESNLELKMQLTYCQNVYCYVVKALCPLTVGDFTLTVEIVEAMFKYKAGEIGLDDVTALIGSGE